jgi:site-specific recombinase
MINLINSDMNTKELLKNHDVSTVEDYFLCIIESRENDQRTQTKELYNKLDPAAKNNFLNFLDIFCYYDKEENEDPVLEFLKYIN